MVLKSRVEERRGRKEREKKGSFNERECDPFCHTLQEPSFKRKSKKINK
jgi:hypothetical protein